MSNKVTTLKYSQIVPDEKQPRKYFDAEKLRTLKDSIKKYGIINPIHVQEMGKDKFLLVDGERRHKAAGLLKMDEVPVIIEKPTSTLERRLRQFNIQEQHAEWTMQEKAIAILDLAEELKQTVSKTCELLNVTEGDRRKYTAFAGIVARDEWVRNEIPFDYASYVHSVCNTAQKVTKNILERNFGDRERKQIEMKIIKQIKAGDINGREDVSKLKDVFTKNPKTIAEYVKGNKTPTEMFSHAGARGAHYLRRANNHAGWLSTYAHKFLNVNDVKPTPAQVAVFKRAQESLKLLIASAK